MSRLRTDEIDRVDRQLLRRLQGNGRTPVTQLARAVHLSVAPRKARIACLERMGLIRGYFAHLHPEKLGQSLLA